MSGILYLESVAGIAGDMFVAACVDAGVVHPDRVRQVPQLLGLPDVEVVISDVHRASTRATQISVEPRGDGWREVLSPGGLDSSRDHWHTHYALLVELLQGSKLDEAARTFALEVFRVLAEAEGEAHGVSVEDVTFHEVGAVDSVVDVAMAGVCVSAISPLQTLASPVRLGRGVVRIQHGTHAIPPPASARLSVGFPVAAIPEAIDRTDVELSTPTGLAILKALDPTFVEGWPEGTVRAQGQGAGTLDLGSFPNVLRIVLLEPYREPAARPLSDLRLSPSAEALPYETDRVVELCCNLDDESPERTAWITAKALSMGALDSWITPLVGKKGRLASCVSLLVRPHDLPTFVDFLLRTSSTFGVRYAPWSRYKLSRTTEIRNTQRGPVSYSVGHTANGELVKEKPEYEDLRKIWEDDPDFLP